MSLKTGFHSVYDESFFDAIDYAAAVGFDFVQFDLGVRTFFIDEIPNQRLEEIGEYAARNGVELTFHAPGDNVSLYCDYPLIRKGIVDQFRLITEKANVVNARHITLHAGSYPAFKMVNEVEDRYSMQSASYYKNVLYDNLMSVLEVKGDVLLCIENCGFSKLTMEVVNRILGQNAGLFLALDIAKLYSRNLVLDECVAGFMQDNSQFIRDVHIHDFSREFGKHQSVGDGEIEFETFRDIITQEDAYLTFEIRPREAALLSRTKLSERLGLEDSQLTI